MMGRDGPAAGDARGEGARGPLGVFAALLLAAFVAGGTVFAAAPGPEQARVLLLCSYHAGDPWTDRIVEGFREGLAGRPGAELFVEHLDARRNSPDGLGPALRALLAAKFGREPPDVLVCADDPAYDFLLDNRDALFPGRPLVFCGLNDFTPERRRGRRDITGVNEAPDFKGTIELMLRLQPGVRRLVAVTSDRLSTYRANEERLLRTMRELGDPLELTVLRNPAPDALRQALRLLGPDAAVLRTSALLREDGQELPFVEGGRLLAAASPAPMYMLWDFDLGLGAVGGSIVSGRLQGRAAAELVLRVLDGARADDIAVRESPNELVVEWPGLLRFGLEPERVPAGAEVLGRPESEWSRHRRWLLWGGAFLALQTALMIVLVTAVLRRRRAERALRASEARFRAIFDSVGEGIVLHDAQTGEILDVNRRMSEMYGYSPERIRRLRVEDLSADEAPWSQAEAMERLRRARSEGPQSFDWRARDCDGHLFWVAVGMRAARLDGEERVLVTVRDITDRKRTEQALADLNRDLERMVAERTEELRVQAEQLLAANRRLTELDRLKSAFLSSVSHELRTPLTAILGFAKITAKEFSRHFSPFAAGAPEVEERAERIVANLAIIGREGERLTRLINDFLDLTRIESGQVEWADREIDAAAVIRRAAEAARGLFGDLPEVRYEIEVERALPRLVMDPDRLEQVVGSLVSNAAKFTRQGRVLLRAARTAAGGVRIEVRDTGCGIPAGELERIFDKFHQAGGGDAVTGKPTGAGLGLAICRDIVRRYGGVIRAESEEGEGAAIIVELPGPA